MWDVPEQNARHRHDGDIVKAFAISSRCSSDIYGVYLKADQALSARGCSGGITEQVLSISARIRSANCTAEATRGISAMVVSPQALVGASTKEDIYEAAAEALLACQEIRDGKRVDAIFVMMSTSYLVQATAKKTNVREVIRSIRDDIPANTPLFGAGAVSVGVISSKLEVFSATADQSHVGEHDECVVRERLFAVALLDFNGGVSLEGVTIRNMRSSSSRSCPVQSIDVSKAAEKNTSGLLNLSIPSLDILMLNIVGTLRLKKLRAAIPETRMSGGLLFGDADSAGSILNDRIIFNKTSGIALSLSKNIVVDELVFTDLNYTTSGKWATNEKPEGEMQQHRKNYNADCEKRRSEGIETRPLCAVLISCYGRVPGMVLDKYRAKGGDLERFARQFPGVPCIAHYSGSEVLPTSTKLVTLSCVFNLFSALSPVGDEEQ